MMARGLLSLLLVLPLAGCLTGTSMESTTGAATDTSAAVPMAPQASIFPGPDFGILGFVSIPDDTERPRLVAYGTNAAYQPFVGILDTLNHTWATAQLSPMPSSFMAVYGSSTGSHLGILFGLRDAGGDGAWRAGWATFDGAAWQVEPPSNRWLLRTPGGLAHVESRTYALLVGDSVNRALDVWSWDGNGWRQEVGVGTEGGFAATLSGNRTHLHVCAWDGQGNVVLLSKTPDEAAYRRETLADSAAAEPLIAGRLSCALASPADGPPTLAWHQYPVRLSTMAQGESGQLYGARFEKGWQTAQIGNRSGDARGLVVAAGAAFLLSGHTPDSNGDLWRLSDGDWSRCEGAMEPDEGEPDILSWMLVQWGAGAAFVNEVHPGAKVVVQPLSTTTPSCA